MQANRDSLFSIAKGIAIILMVIGHSGCPDALSNIIYMFHMPLFFILSGMLFKESYLEDKVSSVTFLKKRIKGLYFPYVKYGLLFLLFHNVFYYLNIYNSVYGFRGQVSHIYGVHDFIHGFLNVITMTGAEQLLGGYWFLEFLFLGGGNILYP